MAAKQNQSIEFVVKPKEDLFLDGGLRKIRRVSQGEPYPCQMQTTQSFSCLFRHYAKHNGLKKEDLVFYFVDELLPDQTPEMVHLMPQDEILVDYRKQSEFLEKKMEGDALIYSNNFRDLFESGIHSDMTFIVGSGKDEVRVHKAVLAARSDYFRAMFREGGLAESTQSSVEISAHEKETFCRAMEYIYTNTIRNLSTVPSQDIISLLELSNEYCLIDLQHLCENAASRVLNFENIGRFLLLSSNNGCTILLAACMAFVRENRTQLHQDDNFRAEIMDCAALGLLVFDAWSNVDSNIILDQNQSSQLCHGIPSYNPSTSVQCKRRRVTEQPSSSADHLEGSVARSDDYFRSGSIGSTPLSYGSSVPGHQIAHSILQNSVFGIGMPSNSSLGSANNSDNNMINTNSHLHHHSIGVLSGANVLINGNSNANNTIPAIASSVFGPAPTTVAPTTAAAAAVTVAPSLTPAALATISAAAPPANAQQNSVNPSEIDLTRAYENY